jgi:hypothetical protein
MNESFACYSEYLWREYKYGKDNADEWLYDNTTYPHMETDSGADLELNELESSPLINPHFKHPNEQFDDIRYNKGAQILHELRHYIGTEAFYKSMNCYLNRFAYQNGNAYDWKKCIEHVTGKNMDHFFNSWYFQGGEFMLFYKVEKDPSTNQYVFLGDPGIAESRAAKHYLKKYGKTKFQQVYIHLLGVEGKTWDTSLFIYPHQEEFKIPLPFQDSQLFVRYTNPQNDHFSFDMRNYVSRKRNNDEISTFLMHRAQYVLSQNAFSYMEKVHLLDEIHTEFIEVGISKPEFYPLVLTMIQEAILIENGKSRQQNQPLLAKMTHELCIGILSQIDFENETFMNNFIHPYQDIIFKAFLSSKATNHQVFYLNFLQRLESFDTKILKKTETPEAQKIIEKLRSSNNLAALEAYFYHGLIHKANIITVVLDILYDSSNTDPVKYRFLLKIWDVELEEWMSFDVKKALLAAISEENWPDDLKVKWIERIFSSDNKNESLLLDAWIPMISKKRAWLLATQFALKSSWESLKRNGKTLNSQESLRFNILESLFSIKP